MTKLFSYVVDHDTGFAPNPSDGYCTLAQCKFGTKRKNIIELAEVGDWIVGTGGVRDVSAGHGKLIYAMRIEEKLTLVEYYRDERFQGREDITRDSTEDITNRFALISRHFFYFGRNAIGLNEIHRGHLDHPLEKKGPGFRSDFSNEFIEDFAQWIERTYQVGEHGDPCGNREESSLCIRLKKPCT